MSTEAATKDLAIREPNWTAPQVPLPIRSHEQYVEVANGLKAVKDFQQEVTEFFKDMKDRAHKTWKSIVAKEKETLALPNEWERECKSALAAWDTEQERLRLEEQRRLEAAARKEEEERRMAEAAALEQEALEEGDESKLAEAQQLIEEPVEAPVVTVPKTTPKVSGIQYREVWSAKVVDQAKLVQYVAQNPQFANLVQPNMPALNALARSLKGNLTIPGVKAVGSKTVAAR